MNQPARLHRPRAPYERLHVPLHVMWGYLDDTMRQALARNAGAPTVHRYAQGEVEYNETDHALAQLPFAELPAALQVSMHRYLNGGPAS